jgi:hypothetical protein
MIGQRAANCRGAAQVFMRNGPDDLTSGGLRERATLRIGG